RVVDRARARATRVLAQSLDARALGIELTLADLAARARVAEEARVGARAGRDANARWVAAARPVRRRRAQRVASLADRAARSSPAVRPGARRVVSAVRALVCPRSAGQRGGFIERFCAALAGLLRLRQRLGGAIIRAAVGVRARRCNSVP